MATPLALNQCAWVRPSFGSCLQNLQSTSQPPRFKSLRLDTPPLGRFRWTDKGIASGSRGSAGELEGVVHGTSSCCDREVRRRRRAIIGWEGELEGVGHGTPSSRKGPLEYQSGDALKVKICEEQFFDTSGSLPRVKRKGPLEHQSGDVGASVGRCKESEDLRRPKYRYTYSLGWEGERSARGWVVAPPRDARVRWSISRATQ